MGTQQFTVKKIKYDKKWEYASTRKWMENSWNELTRLCENTSTDYQRYGPDEFARLEQQIASYVFGITSEYAERALKMNNLLKVFGDSERRFARNIRKKMENIAGGNTIDVQVIPIYALLEENIGKKDAPSAQIYVFRVRDKKNGWKFVDCALRKYKDFDDYLANNRTPQCMMCYPVGGFLRAQQEKEDENGNIFTASEVHFGEPPSCTFTGRAVKTLDRINMVVSPIVAVTLFWTPAGWIATGLTALSVSSLGYSLIRQATNIMDKSTHGEHYATDLFHFATTIATLAASRAIPSYLRTVALQNRQLTFWESTIITGILRGMAATTAVNFAAMVYQFGCRLVNQPTEISAMDVVNLVVAAQNMYSCCMSPKSAKAMLEKVKVEIQAENQAKILDNEKNIKKAQKNNKELEQDLKKMKESGSGDAKKIDTLEKKIETNNKKIETWRKDAQVTLEKFMENQRNWSEADVKETLAPIKERQGKIKNIKNENAKMKQELEKLENSTSGDLRRIEELKSKIVDNNEKIDHLTNEALTKQNEFLDKKGEKMKDDGAKEEYKKFVKEQQSKRGSNTVIDQNNRIIQAVTYMDAEQVFKMVSITQSKICFANAETLDLLINNEVTIHPRAVDQLNRTSVRRTTNAKGERSEITKNDLEEIMRVTQQYDSNNITKEDYLTRINGELQKYQMISRTEITEVQNDVMQRMSNMSDEQKRMFENMRPSLAFRMRTVLKGASSGDMEAALKIAETQNAAGTPFGVADCVEIVKLHFSKEMKAFELEKTKINERNDMNAAQKQSAIDSLYRKHFDLSDKDMKTMSNNQVSNKNKAKLLADRFADSVVNNDQRRAVMVKHINEKVGQIKACAESEQLFHGNLLSAYYHVEKHYEKTVPAYYDETNAQAPQNAWTQESINDVYFKEMKNLIFSENNYRSTLVGQDGHTKTRIWATDKKYTGYTKTPNTFVPYEELLGNPPLYFPSETVASHFQK